MQTSSNNLSIKKKINPNEKTEVEPHYPHILSCFTCFQFSPVDNNAKSEENEASLQNPHHHDMSLGGASQLWTHGEDKADTHNPEEPMVNKREKEKTLDCIFLIKRMWNIMK